MCNHICVQYRLNLFVLMPYQDYSYHWSYETPMSPLFHAQPATVIIIINMRCRSRLYRAEYILIDLVITVFARVIKLTYNMSLP